MTTSTLEHPTPVEDVAGDRHVLAAMLHNWRLMAARGGLAALFGASILLWPAIALPTIVVLFAAYAVADGVLGIVAAGRGPLRLLDAWPVALEGLVSVAIGVLAFVAPLRVPRDVVSALALWGIATGILELAYAARLPRTASGYWLLMAAGVSSLFLAALLLTLPYADAAGVARVIGLYAIAFGVLVSLAAFAVARSARPA